MQIEMPRGANYIIDTLKQAGFEAYIVGGCVRDAVLGLRPHDWDITTNARPEQVKRLFGKTIDTGIQHGTVTVLVPKSVTLGELPYDFEVTTYRLDGVYEDHRRPKAVTFTGALSEDLARRDFTINAMAYNHEDGLVDIYGGQKDLTDGVIRCVGNPEERFSEDALRVLRAVRFAAKLDFVIEDDTRMAIRTHVLDLAFVSAERIREELTKLLISDHPGRIREAYKLGITGVVLPEFDRMMEQEQNNPYHCYSVGEHTIHVVEAVPPEVHLRYAALLHDVAKPACHTTDEKGIDHFYGHPQIGTREAVKILRRLKFDNDTIRKVERLVRYHDYDIGDTEKGMRHFLAKFGTEDFPDYMKLRRADMAGQSSYRLDERRAYLERLEELYQAVTSRGDCLSLKELALSGRDLMEMGVPAGPGLGRMLDKLLTHVLDHPEDNNREALIKYLHI